MSQGAASVGDARRVYAIGDIHGRSDLLEELHGRILEDAGRHPDAQLIVVYLGDYVDRGADSAGVVEALIEHPLQGFEQVRLKGNHEDFMMQFLDGSDSMGRGWFMNGGRETLESYGVTVPRFLLPGSMAKMRSRLAEALPERHAEFYRSLSLTRVIGDYLFVHAGIRPNLPLPRQTADDLLWIRDEFLQSEEDFGMIVVHGHSIAGDPVFRPNRIGIDTGAYATNILTCLVLAGTGRTLIQTEDTTGRPPSWHAS